ncbi:stage III sporulation protein AG [Clostridium sediminicola]|uniref:stage III sporulation protein AG n=1 Tax=Clostridium sediminicola TaxID=3114879 RepID=UPI0031F22C42
MKINEFLHNNLKNSEKKLSNKLSKKLSPNIIILILIAILLIIVSENFGSSKPIFSNKDTPKVEDTNTIIQVSQDYQTQVEEELKSILEHIDGVGKVVVMINFEGGEEQVPAINTNDSTSLTEENDGEGGTRKTTQNNDGKTVVMMNGDGGNEPLILKKISPSVEGVCVVAEGASNDLMKLNIQKAVITLFGIPENKVTVYPMKK